MSDRAENRGSSAAGAGRTGFTLVELLLVMFVMAVLVALVVGVGAYVIEEGKKSETKNSMRYVELALEEYYKVMHRYLFDCLSGTAYDPNQARTLLADHLNGTAASLGDQKSVVVEATKAYTANISGTEIPDAFGKPMRYYANQGLGGKPVLISAGPDGKFGDEDAAHPVDRDKNDNIRSDTKD